MVRSFYFIFIFLGLKGCRKKVGVRTPWTPPLDPPLTFNFLTFTYNPLINKFAVRCLIQQLSDSADEVYSGQCNCESRVAMQTARPACLLLDASQQGTDKTGEGYNCAK